MNNQISTTRVHTKDSAPHAHKQISSTCSWGSSTRVSHTPENEPWPWLSTIDLCSGAVGGIVSQLNGAKPVCSRSIPVPCCQNTLGSCILICLGSSVVHKVERHLIHTNSAKTHRLHTQFPPHLFAKQSKSIMMPMHPHLLSKAMAPCTESTILLAP